MNHNIRINASSCVQRERERAREPALSIYYRFSEAVESFHAITLNECGGYSSDAPGFLVAISHKGDKLKKDKEGERFFHESMTFVSTKSRAWILQRAGVARACGMYRGAAQAVMHTMRSAADAFPRAFSYDSSGTA